MKLNATIVGTGLAALTLLGSLYAVDLNQETTQHETLTEQIVAGDVELDLQRVELELKLLRTIEERRPLTSDEADRQAYLIELRRILREQQQRKIG